MNPKSVKRFSDQVMRENVVDAEECEAGSERALLRAREA